MLHAIVPIDSPPFALPSPRTWLAGVRYDASEVRDHRLVDGRPIESVTRLLRLAGKSSDFGRVKPEVLRCKGLIGTAAHLAAHFYDEGDLATASVDPRVSPYLQAWIRFREQRRFVPQLLETVVFSRQHGYVGRLDRVGTVDNGRRLVLLDIKTGDPDAARADLQLMAYELALIEEMGSAAGALHLDRWSVRLFADGRYQLCQYPASGRTWRHDKVEFLEALMTARAESGIAWKEPEMPVDLFSAVEPSEPPFEPPDDEPQAREQPGPEPESPPSRPALSGPAFEPPDYEPALDDASSALSLKDRLVERKNTIVARANALATAVKDAATCAAAAHFAIFVNDALKDAHDYFDPLVERARKPYQDRLDERNAVCKPLEDAKDLLTGKNGAVTRWYRSEQERAEAEQRRLQREADERAEVARQEERRRAAEADAAARKAREDAELARRAGELEKAASLSREAAEKSDIAAEAHQAADSIESTVVTVQAETPQVAGVSGRDRWTFEVTNLEEFICAVARKRVLKQLLVDLRGTGMDQTEEGRRVLGVIAFVEEESPEIPYTLLQDNAVTCRASANVNRNTVKWPGIRFVNAGSTAVKSSQRPGKGARS